MNTLLRKFANAILALLFLVVVSTVAAQPAMAVSTNGNAYAYGKTKKTETTESTAVATNAAEVSGSSAAQTATQAAEQHAATNSAVQNKKQTVTTTTARTVPGDNGDVKTHNVGTAVSDHRDEPKVCQFYLDAFNFDAQQSVTWKIVKHTHGETVLTGTITLTNGNGATQNYSLPNGMYKLYWNFNGEHGSAKHKVFKVTCAPTKETPTTPTTPAGRGGQVLGESTTKPASATLANTGDSPMVQVVLATVLLTAAVAAATIKNRKIDFDAISI